MKFKIIGDESQYVDESYEKTEQLFVIDDIKIMYTRNPIPISPTNITASQISNSIELTWQMPDSKEMDKELDVFNVYRDGIKIDQTVELSFVDNKVSSYTTYQYAITRQLDLDYMKETSAFDCNINITTDLILFPMPVNFSATLGTGTEYNCVTLNWSPPSEGIIEYDIYRNGVYYNSTLDSTYFDAYLPDGDYNYYLIAKYSDPVGESWATDTKSVSIIPPIIPVVECFENGGVSPEFWTSGEYETYFYPDHDNLWKYVTINPQGLQAYDGNYFASMGVGPFTSKQTPDSLTGTDYLTSPQLDLTGYEDISITFKYLVQSNFTAKNKSLKNWFRIRYSNEDFWNLPDGTPYMNVWNTVGIYEFDLTEESGANTEWKSISIPVSNDILTNQTAFQIVGNIELEDATQYLCYNIDSLVIDGTIEFEIPTNLIITNENPNIKLIWDAVAGATCYKVYSSGDPYGTFTEDTSGSFNGEEWIAPLTLNKLFYYVIALNACKNDVIKSNTRNIER
ncbi:MAG: hypothetical protein GQ534_01960 [Candidatus Delongbacteria bacterium]|nr:hypothetical protein [Candidatus Delongbacteria bacterium]